MDGADNFEAARNHFFAGLEYMKQKNWLIAEEELRKSLSLVPDRLSTLTNLSAVLIRSNKYEQAAEFITRALQLNPDHPEVLNNAGILDADRRQFADAIAKFDRVIEVKPDYIDAWINRAMSLDALGKGDEAVLSFDRALQLDPQSLESWLGRGAALLTLNKPKEAVECFKNAQEFATDPRAILPSLTLAQLKVCDWSDFDTQLGRLRSVIKEGDQSAIPLATLGLFDDPELQRLAARAWTGAECADLQHSAMPMNVRPKERIRLGYFSMDFRAHPVSYLIADLIESHNRDHFEVIGFSFGKDTQDPLRKRFEKSFDKFFDCREMSDREIAGLSRDESIDIAIDLGGHTQDARPRIFTERAAPVQVSYLGYPGTWGAGCIDYFIGDKVAVTEENKPFFSEKIVFMPHQFQVNPRSRPVSAQQTSRGDFGLPADRFVFCCLNNNWKITPETFACWMRILASVPDSVLWLYADNPSIVANLQREAQARNIPGSRLIFTKKLPRDLYMSQYFHADLFLDTLPYNAGTTASDALWAGLPVLTQAGHSFAGRMAASLLSAVGLEELVTSSKKEYEGLAVELATSPSRLCAIKETLGKNRLTHPLFDTALFTRHLENAFQLMHERHHAGLAPDDLFINA